MSGDMALTREDLDQYWSRTADLIKAEGGAIRAECNAIKQRQDDMLAQQRITNGRVSNLEQVVAGNAVKIENLDAETKRNRESLHRQANDIQATDSVAKGARHHVEDLGCEVKELHSEVHALRIRSEQPFATPPAMPAVQPAAQGIDQTPITIGWLRLILIFGAAVAGLVIYLASHGFQFGGAVGGALSK